MTPPLLHIHSSSAASTIGPLAATIMRYCALYHPKTDLRIDADRCTIYMFARARVCGNTWAYITDIYTYTRIYLHLYVSMKLCILLYHVYFI
jgi:hypothetical protein